MKRVEEALKRIDIVITRNLPELDLRGLELTTEDLSTLIPRIAAHANLKHLDISENSLDGLPRNIGELARLSQLRYLDLSKNDIRTLPPEIAQLTSLKELRVSGNELDVLPAEIGNLANLRTLALEHNNLTKLPGTIGDLVQLNHLLLRDNKLRYLPKMISGLRTLQWLELSQNSLVVLPSLKELTSLEVLDLDANRLGDIPEISSLTGLKKLNVKENPLSFLTRAELVALQAGSSGQLKVSMSPASPEQRWVDGFEEVKEDVLRLVDVLNPESFEDDSGNTMPASEILCEFVEKMKDRDLESSAFIYIPALRHLNRRLFCETPSEEERQHLMEQIAITLGNCATPVKDFLTGIYIVSQLGSEPYEKLPLMAQRVIEREALQDWIIHQPDFWTGTNVEKIEAAQGLLNSVYSKQPIFIMNFSTSHIPVFVSLDREDCFLHAKSGNFEFAYSQVTECMRTLFLEKFSSRAEEGRFQVNDYKIALNIRKIDAVREDYLEVLGFPTEQTREISKIAGSYETEIKQLLEQTELSTVHFGEEEVKSFLERMPAQIKELRMELRDAGDNRQQVYEEYLAEVKSMIMELSAKYNPEPMADLSRMGSPVNSRKRHESGWCENTQQYSDSTKRPKL